MRMIKQNILFLAIKNVFFDTIKDIMRFPIWWYTAGTKKRLNGFRMSVRSGIEILEIKVWAQNIMRPMYAQYDMTGRIISFFKGKCLNLRKKK